jgi:hypothetical protein
MKSVIGASLPLSIPGDGQPPPQPLVTLASLVAPRKQNKRSASSTAGVCF